MYNLTIAGVLKRMNIYEMAKFVYENCCKQVGFNQENVYFSKEKRITIICSQINS